MKKRTMLYALILSAMMIFSAFAVGCNPNDTVNAAIDKTATMLKTTNNYTIRLISDTDLIQSDIEYKHDGIKIETVYENDVCYYYTEISENGNIVYEIKKWGSKYFKDKADEQTSKWILEFGTIYGDIISALKSSQIKWEKGEEPNTFKYTLKDGFEAEVVVKIENGYITEIKTTQSVSSYTQSAIIKISNIGTTVVVLPDVA